MLVTNSHKLYRGYNTPGGQTSNVYEKILSQGHTLIAGETGSGKSVMINGLVYTIAVKNNAQMVLCDPKMVELNMYKFLPQTLMFADSAADIKKALQNTHKIMMDRYAKLSQRMQREWSGGDIYVIVDEFADLIMDREHGKEIVDLLQSLCQLGRAAHIHCILATQSPSRKTLKAEITLNITCKIALHCMSAIESKQIIGTAGAENLPQHGECLMRIPGKLYNADVHMYSEAEINRVVGYYMIQRIA